MFWRLRTPRNSPLPQTPLTAGVDPAATGRNAGSPVILLVDLFVLNVFRDSRLVRDGTPAVWFSDSLPGFEIEKIEIEIEIELGPRFNKGRPTHTCRKTELFLNPFCLEPFFALSSALGTVVLRGRIN